jgi:hypothetical protein
MSFASEIETQTSPEPLRDKRTVNAYEGQMRRESPGILPPVCKAGGQTIRVGRACQRIFRKPCLKSRHFVWIATRSVVMNLVRLSRPGSKEGDSASRSDAMNENSGLVSVVARRRIISLVLLIRP